MDPFATIADWPGRSAAAIVHPSGRVERHGDTTEPFALASITKLLTAMTALVAHEEGTLDLDEELAAAGATTADLLAHSAGIAPDSDRALAPPHPSDLLDRRLRHRGRHDRRARRDDLPRLSP